VGCL